MEQNPAARFRAALARMTANPKRKLPALVR